MTEPNVAPATLMQLTAQAMATFLGHAPRFEAECRAGLWKTICGEPVADLNYLIAMRDTPETIEALKAVVADLDRRSLPFCCMIAPGTERDLAPACEASGLVYAVDWPLMVCPADRLEVPAREDVAIAAVRSDRDASDMATVLAGAFNMPEDVVRRTLPLSMTQVPGIDVFLARVEERAACTVTVTRHGHVAGIWAMGTLPEVQGQGVGKVLLSRVMNDCRAAGIETFFLGATPAGLPLYEKLGYREIAKAQVWVRGETSQA